MVNGLIETSVRDLLNTIFRHKWKIVAVALCVWIGVVAYTFLIQELYRSDAKVLVRLGRSVAVDPAVTGPTMALLGSRDNEVKSEVSILQSRDLFEQVVENLGENAFLMKPDELASLEEGKKQLRIMRRLMRSVTGLLSKVLVAVDLKVELSDHEKALKQGMDNLTVEVERNTSTINVYYDAPGAELAKTVLDNLIHFYQIRHIQVHASEATPDFFEGQTAELLAEVSRLEGELESYRTENGIVDLQRQKEAILERIVSLDGRVSDLSADADGSYARFQVLKKALDASKPIHELNSIVRNENPVRDNLKQVLVSLRHQETEYASLYPDTDRRLIQLRKQIQQTQEVLDGEELTRTEVTTGINSIYQDLFLSVEQEHSLYESKAAARDKLAEKLSLAQEQLEVLAGRQIALARLERNLEMAIEEYEGYRDNLMRSRVSTALDQANVSNVSVIQEPSLPIGPHSPDKPLNLGLGLILGCFAGLCFAFLLEYLDDSLRTKEKVERRLGVPVLSVLSEKEFKGCI